ncbi:MULTISPECIES: DNA-binding protein [unclassified Hydrogenophaga]|uniref:DNA-binding protein n=1 Tax=unclassified Hydrogenophaga TaxID=2610897 RepID=UPI0009E994E4|nr:DNA-binding protein [Hydrogenophaga sp.]MCW5669552.1 DNA-binding protein [Hydrogenophaga sp.]OSZ76373.1 hypothetical protein CAP37_13835 [Hydrogenophaga sp. IBVHS1]
MPTKSTRVSRGVQVDDVWAAADGVLAQRKRPTIERVRTHLGRGSAPAPPP